MLRLHRTKHFLDLLMRPFEFQIYQNLEKFRLFYYRFGKNMNFWQINTFCFPRKLILKPIISYETWLSHLIFLNKVYSRMASWIQLFFRIVFYWFLHHFIKLWQNHTLTPMSSWKWILFFLINYRVIVMYNIFHRKHAGSPWVDRRAANHGFKLRLDWLNAAAAALDQTAIDRG